MKALAIIQLVTVTFLVTESCRQAEFQSDSSTSRRPATVSPSPIPTISPVPSGPTLPPAGPTPTPTPVPPVVNAIECNTTTIKWANETTRCPANYAAFALDDAKNTSIACCPLPAADILTADAPIARAPSCNPDEVAVGGSPGGGLLCQKLNLNRYVMLLPQVTCYYGSGVAGGWGSSNCSAPPATIQAMTTTFGSDSCLPVPFGALITTHGNNGNCSSSKANVLIFRDTGQPVPMFK